LRRIDTWSGLRLSAPTICKLEPDVRQKEKNDGLEEGRIEDGRTGREECGAASRKGNGARCCDEDRATGYDDDGKEENRSQALIGVNAPRRRQSLGIWPDDRLPTLDPGLPRPLHLRWKV
jgi:hypothetical protein